MKGGDCISAPVPLGDVTKFGRGDSASPAPPTTLAQPQQSQSQAHHTAQQPFLSPALPPGYSYTGLPYYTGVPSAFQYGPTMFVSIGGGVPPAPGSRSREGGTGPHSGSPGLEEWVKAGGDVPVSSAWRPSRHGTSKDTSLLPEAELGRPAPLTLFSTNASCLSLPQVPPASAKQHGVSLSTPSTPFQQASGYGQHSYGTGEGAPSPERHGQDWLTELTHASCPRHARL